MHCVGTLSWSGMGLVWPANHPSGKDLSLGIPAKPLRRNLEVLATGARRPRQIPDGKELVQGRLQASLAVHPTDQDLPVGVQAVAPAARPVCREAASLEIDWSQVVRRCMDGDSGAWAELVRTHHRRVYGLCYRFTGNPADAEDLTQDVFLKIYSNLASFDMGRGSLQVWITTMTRNLLVDNFRRTRNQRATSSLDDGWESAEELKPIDRLTARGAFAARVGGQKGTGKDGAGGPGPRLGGAARGRDSARFTGFGLQGDRPGAGHSRGDGQIPHQPGPRGTCEAAGT